MRFIPFKRSFLLPLLLLLAGAAWIWLSRPAPGEAAASEAAPRQGFLAPDFSLQDAAGNTVTLSELRGQPVVLNFWASWCPPCRAEMPALERVAREYESLGLALFAVNATHQDDLEEAQNFLAEQGLDELPVLFDLQGEANGLYQVRSLPTTFFIDADGVIREVVIGGPMSEALLRARIERLFQEGQP